MALSTQLSFPKCPSQVSEWNRADRTDCYLGLECALVSAVLILRGSKKPNQADPQYHTQDLCVHLGTPTQAAVTKFMRKSSAAVCRPALQTNLRNGKAHRPQLQLTRGAQRTGLCNNYHYLTSFHKEPLEEQGLKLESNDSPFSSVYAHKTPAAQQEGGKAALSYTVIISNSIPNPKIPSCLMACHFAWLSLS